MKLLCRWILVSYLVLFVQANLFGQAITWNATSGNWSDSFNWLPSTVPTAADDVILDNGGIATVLPFPSASAANVTMGSMATNNGTIVLTAASNTNFESLFAGVGGSGYVISNNGTMGLNGNLSLGVNPLSYGNLSFTGDFGVVSVSGTNVNIGAAGLGEVTFDNSAQFQATNSTTNVTLGRQITGVGKILLKNAASMTLAGNTVFSENGTAQVDLLNNANLNLGNVTLGQGADGSGTLSADASTIVLNGEMTLGDQGNGTLFLSNGGSLTALSTTQNITLGRDFNSSGTINLNGGGTGLSAPNAPSLIVGRYGNGTLNVLNGAFLLTNNITIQEDPSAFGWLNISGNGSQATINNNVASAGLITVEQGGTLFTGNAIVLVGGTGNATVSGSASARGQIQTNFIQASGNGEVLIFDGGRFTPLQNISEAFPGFDSLSLSTLKVVNDGLFFNTNGLVVATNSTIQGTGALTVEGDGELELKGESTYTAGTKVEGNATLRVNNISGSATGTGGVTVGANATLAGNGTVDGIVVALGTIAPGNSIGNLTVNQNVIWQAGSTWKFELGTGAASQSLAASGNSTQDKLIITSGSFQKSGTGSWTFDFLNTGNSTGWYQLVTWGASTTFSSADFVATNLPTGYTGNFSIVGNALYVHVIPEPASVLLLLGAGGTLALIRRMRGRRAAARLIVED